MSTNTTDPAPLCAADGSPAAVVLIHVGQHTTIGAALCESCASCTDTRCGELGTILDSTYEEPWCAEHREAWTAVGEPVHGPDIVPLGSPRHHEALAEQCGGTR